MSYLFWDWCCCPAAGGTHSWAFSNPPQSHEYSFIVQASPEQVWPLIVDDQARADWFIGLTGVHRQSAASNIGEEGDSNSDELSEISSDCADPRLLIMRLGRRYWEVNEVVVACEPDRRWQVHHDSIFYEGEFSIQLARADTATEVTFKYIKNLKRAEEKFKFYFVAREDKTNLQRSVNQLKALVEAN